MRMRILGLAAILTGAVAAGPALAQTAGGEQGSQPQANEQTAPFVTTFDCNSAMRPDQTAICSSPQLAAMDLQTATLFTVVKKFLTPAEQQQLEGGQKGFLDTRAACGADFQCIGQVYVRRMGQLDDVLTAAANELKTKKDGSAGSTESK